MDFSKLFGFVKVDPCISHPLPNKTKLKFNQDFKPCWSFYSDLKALSESKYSMPWVRCAFGNVYLLYWLTPLYPHILSIIIFRFKLPSYNLLILGRGGVDKKFWPKRSVVSIMHLWISKGENSNVLFENRNWAAIDKLQVFAASSSCWVALCRFSVQRVLFENPGDK